MSNTSKGVFIKPRQPKKIPSTLETLFQRSDFITSAGDNDKICFKRNEYYNKHSLYGKYIRGWDGETSSDLIKRITEIQTQLFEQYAICTDEDFSNLILTKLVELRAACIRFRDTTYSGEIPEKISFNSIIRAIEVGLPEEIKENQGIPKIGGGIYHATPFTGNQTSQADIVSSSPKPIIEGEEIS